MSFQDTMGCSSLLNHTGCNSKIHHSASGALPKVGVKVAAGWFLFPDGHAVCPDCAKKCVDFVRTIQERFC